MTTKRRNFPWLVSLMPCLGFTRAANDAAADDDGLAVANAAGGEAVFEIAQDGSFFVPFGEYPHRVGLQIFDRAAAESMVASHNSALSKLKRWAGVQSYPVYVGHPDVPGSKDTDKAAYGWIHEMTVENDGMRFGVKYNDEGRALVANAKFRFYSPYWWMAKAGKGLRPTRLISMGLTNNPNIPVPALANEDEGSPRGDAAAAEENAGDDAAAGNELETVRGELATANEAITTLTGELETVRGELATANATIATLTGERDAAAADLTAANEALSALRGVMIDGALAEAVANGRVLIAEREALRDDLAAANDLAAELAALRALPVKLKTTSTTGDLGAAKVQVVTAHNDGSRAARDERKLAIANELERISATMPDGARKQLAWQRAAAKNPDLFKNQSPGTAA